jgi:hypothetical protein
MKATFAGKVRTAIRELCGSGIREFSVDEIALGKLDLLTGAEKRPVRAVLHDMAKAGEIERVRPGVYRTVRRGKAKPELQHVMWDILRFRKKVTIEDLVELAGATDGYAKEWLENLAHWGVVRRTGSPGVWQMIADPVAMPRNDHKAERLRELRRIKRERITALCDTLFKAVADLRMEVNSAADDREDT